MNNIIKLNSTPDITIKKLKTSDEAEFHISIKGKSVDYSIVNTIRRTILQHIPIYGFHRKNTIIEHEKCVYMYNNDFMYNQIETLPLYDIPNNITLDEIIYTLPHDTLKNIFGENISQTDLLSNRDNNKKIHNIEFLLNVKNNTDAFKFVNTHDAVLKIDGKISNNYKNHPPVSIIVLKPNEEVHLRSVANLSVAGEHAIYEATTNAIHKEISSTEYELMYETLGQLNKNVIFEKACMILVKKLEYLEKYINDTYIKNDDGEKRNMVTIELIGEDDTMGNLLTTILQKSEYVEKAGYAVPHPLIKRVVIDCYVYENSKYKPLHVFVKVIHYAKNVFEHILSQWKV